MLDKQRKPLLVKPADLMLGDMIRLSGGGWDMAIVKAIKDGAVTLFRPYGQTADFTMGNSIICYIGLEEFTVFTSSTAEYELVERRLHR